MARPNTFRNLVCMADLFFALSASLFLLSAQEGKTLEGEQPLLERKPDIAAIAQDITQLEAVAARLQRELAQLQARVRRLDRGEEPASTQPRESPPPTAPSPHD